MNTFNLSFDTSKVFNAFDAMMLRFSLLIADKTYSAGDLHWGIRMDEGMEKENVTIKSKISFIEAHASHGAYNIGMTEEDFAKTKASYKALKMVKSKNAAQIKHIYEIEKFVNICYDKLNSDYSHIFARAGMTQLRMFMDDGLLFHCVDPKKAEVVEQGQKSYYTISELFLDRLNRETSDELFLVTGDFSDYLKENNIAVSQINGEINKDAAFLCASNILSLPHIVMLTTNEIEIEEVIC